MNILSLVTNLIDQYGYIAIIISAFLEGASVPFPGSAVLALAGFLIRQGEINLWVAIFLAAASYSIASIIPYSIGKKLKETLFDFLEDHFKISRKKVENIKKIFNQYGEISVCITRSFFIGNYISYFAGIAQVPLIKYFPFTFIGILPWAFSYLVLGYIFRGSLEKVANFLDQYNVFGIWTLVGIGIAVLFIILKWYRSRKSKNRESDRE